MQLLLVILFSIGCIEEPNLQSQDLSHTQPAELQTTTKHNEKIRLFQKIAESAIYLGTGTIFESISLLSRLGWGVCLPFPWASTLGNELLFFSDLCSGSGKYFLRQTVKGVPSSDYSSVSEGIAFSQKSWHLNREHLSQISADTEDDKKLLLFLEKRWLSKSNGFFSSAVKWIYPCFGISLQVHPETTSSYSRNPFVKFSQTYIHIVEEWKKSLPHPPDYPLILTRPSNLHQYLPLYFDSFSIEHLPANADRLEQILKKGEKAIVDVTSLFEDKEMNKEQWLKTWETHQTKILKICQENNIDPAKILCIQRVQKEEIGGIRLLPFTKSSSKEIKQDHRYLLEWIGSFGLTANRVELDRWPFPIESHKFCKRPSQFLTLSAKNDILSQYKSFKSNWHSDHPQKKLMVYSTLELLEGLCSAISEEKWEEIKNCPTRSAAAQLYFVKINEKLKLLEKEPKSALFFETSTHLDEIHSSLSCLLEIFTPYSPSDFSRIYKESLSSLPEALKPMTSCSLLATGMSSLLGIFKAVEKTNGSLRILYGENTYWESVNTAKRVTQAMPIEEAKEEEWKEADLILAQFNPVLRLVDYPITYRIEKIGEFLKKALKDRGEKPLTLALDCTLDFIFSSQVKELLESFQNEIEAGILSIVGYRSGIKFDIFGMDNYCGAPCYVIHNQDPKWAPFDSLTEEPALQTDPHSTNWFCLAYKYASTSLDLYRKQIFDNTRVLLDKTPLRLLENTDVHYQITPAEAGAEISFIDIKVFGPFHLIKASVLVGGCLFLKSMEGNQTIFTRQSIGFYHPNFSMIFGENCSCVRLTLGLDPSQIDVFVKCFEKLDALNGSANESLFDKIVKSLPFPSLSYLKESVTCTH